MGHATDERVRSGVTAHSMRRGVGGRRGRTRRRTRAPAKREALSPENLVGRAHAVVLAGGSVFGLAAADGVAAALSVKGIGLQLRPGSPPFPSCRRAVLHDLGNGGDKNWGALAALSRLGHSRRSRPPVPILRWVPSVRDAAPWPVLIKGGMGSASLDLGDGLIVGALVALNSVGSALMPDGKTYWAWAFETRPGIRRRRPTAATPWM